MVVIGDVTGRGAQAACRHRPGPLHAAHRRGAHRRPGDRPGNPQPRPAGPPRRLALQRRRDGDRRRPVAAGAPGDRRPPGAAAGRSATRSSRRPSRPRCSAPSPRPAGASSASRCARASSWSSITDGVTESSGAEGRFGEQRLRAELAGVSSPALAAQKLEARAARASAPAPLDDDAAILAIAPTPTVGRAGIRAADRRAGRAALRGLQPPRHRARSSTLCDEALDFFPVGTAEAIGRTAPYVGPAGLHDYLARRRSAPGKSC